MPTPSSIIFSHSRPSQVLRHLPPDWASCRSSFPSGISMSDSVYTSYSLHILAIFSASPSFASPTRFRSPSPAHDIPSPPSIVIPRADIASHTLPTQVPFHPNSPPRVVLSTGSSRPVHSCRSCILFSRMWLTLSPRNSVVMSIMICSTLVPTDMRRCTMLCAGTAVVRIIPSAAFRAPSRGLQSDSRTSSDADVKRSPYIAWGATTPQACMAAELSDCFATLRISDAPRFALSPAISSSSPHQVESVTCTPKYLVASCASRFRRTTLTSSSPTSGMRVT